ncbi:phage holin family protein [Propionibacterium sp.]|uniref:phage holin family protein n=1 Tax=Propionibacterium sp. TaxID=1977903 RepID=UPI0039EBB807
MVKFLLGIVANLVGSAVALLISAWLVKGVHIQVGGFIIAVIVFTIAQAIFTPFIYKLGQEHASAFLGGIGLVSTLISLWIATLFPGGLRIEGIGSWIATVVLVWLINALATWLLAGVAVNHLTAKKAA